MLPCHALATHNGCWQPTHNPKQHVVGQMAQHPEHQIIISVPRFKAIQDSGVTPAQHTARPQPAATSLSAHLLPSIFSPAPAWHQPWQCSSAPIGTKCPVCRHQPTPARSNGLVAPGTGAQGEMLTVRSLIPVLQAKDVSVSGSVKATSAIRNSIHGGSLSVPRPLGQATCES